jgi:hypothetical protein
MANSIRTPRQGKSATSKRIAEAVDNEDWQKYRLAMKGKSTKLKLVMLARYYDEGAQHWLNGKCDEHCTLYVDDEEFENYKIRVDNYIKALCRGGQLWAGESLETALAADWKLTIKR